MRAPPLGVCCEIYAVTLPVQLLRNLSSINDFPRKFGVALRQGGGLRRRETGFRVIAEMHKWRDLNSKQKAESHLLVGEGVLFPLWHGDAVAVPRREPRHTPSFLERRWQSSHGDRFRLEDVPGGFCSRESSSPEPEAAGQKRCRKACARRCQRCRSRRASRRPPRGCRLTTLRGSFRTRLSPHEATHQCHPCHAGGLSSHRPDSPTP